MYKHMNRQWWAVVRADIILFAFKTKEEALEEKRDGEEVILLTETAEVLPINLNNVEDWLV